MIRLDKKVCHDILKITSAYNELILYDPALNGYCHWDGSHPEKPDLASSLSVSETRSSLLRLETSGLIKRIQGISGGGIIFHITAELLHRKAFWIDRTAKPFIAGFVSGIAVGVFANLLTPYISAVIARIAELLRSLI